MSTTLRFKTNLNCAACVAAVKPHLDGDSSISRWAVDTAVPEKTLTVEGETVSADRVRAAVAKAGFAVLGGPDAPASGPTSEPGPPVSYHPLVLLVSYLVGIVAVAEIAAGGFAAERVMRHFMGGFFVAFSFFKLLDLRGFADAYAMYDIVARRFPAWGLVYPFVELMLGVAYLTGFEPVATNVATFVVMSVGAVGVVRSVLAKRRIRCACLGTVFNLPMSTVTLVEDALMIVMAAAMLFSWISGSDSHGRGPESIPMKGSVPMQGHGSHHGSGHGSHDHIDGASLLIGTGSIRPAGRPSDLRMMIMESGGGMIRKFDVSHEEKVHLIIVREGLDTFAHLHPQVDAAGQLEVTYTFPAGGAYRLHADFRPAGMATSTAGARIVVPGESPAAPALMADVPGRVRGDGLQADVSVEKSGATGAAVLRFALSDIDGRPVRDLRPYLGAMGHLNIIGRDGDESIHSHPLDPGPHDASNVVAFEARFGKGGLYKGWGQFRRGDSVHVVPFVVDVR